ncbi:MAG TPA: HD domain-containing protein [Candidatus Acidoferrales bacterium]|nr:HD domain-containing protein [Candidatus Acidoferrales bacterium]
MLIRDPIHGDVSLNPVETAVLDLPDVQRLRGVKQLGTASLVYPGCLHSRFDHSLGVNAVAKRMISGLRERGTRIDADLATAIGVAALLHDVTHVPFGHTLEDERRLFARHDKGGRLYKLLAGRLGESLAKLGLRGAVDSLLGNGESSLPSWARQIVASTIDADLLDYLRRDSYFAGLAQDYDDRIFHHFVVADGQLAIQMSKHGMERPDARSETVQLLRMRYFLTERVYYHHTKVAAGAMVSKAVELAHEHGRFDEDELLQLTDGQLFERLCTIPTAAAPDRRIVRLVERLQTRNLLKRGYVVSALTIPAVAREKLVQRFHEAPNNRRVAEEELAQSLGCDSSEVILYCPALTVMKEALAKVCTRDGLRHLNDTEPGAKSEIQALEERYAQLWRFYVFVPDALARPAAPLAQEIVGFESEHRRG